MGASVLAFGAQRFAPLANELQPVSCCQQAGLLNPGLGLLYLALVNGRAIDDDELKRWRRDFV